MKFNLTKILLVGLCFWGLPQLTFAQELQAIQDGAQILNTPDTGEYFQHVLVSAPEGTEIAPAAEGKFIQPMLAPQY
ncbi:MAG: hypothetical protein IJK97_02390, partial [Thermoguttaceae bacterium]|nr:hypothetical protein [Thermoguttaceae bacterium]